MTDFKYTVRDDHIEITKYTGSASSVTIPSSIDGLPVTSIRYEAFSTRHSLTSVTIPDSVTSIGSSAFYWCKSLTSVTIPNSVTSIGNDAFKECDRLTIYGTEGSAAQTHAKRNKISFSTDPSPYCDAAGFCYSHDGKTLLGAPRSLSGEYTILDSVTSIGNRAFDSCSSLTSVTIPDSVTSIGYRAFRGCTNLTSVTIPNSVTSIGSLAFQGCKNLTSVTIPNSVTSIGNYAFYGCKSLTSVTIPNSVTSIGNSAFSSCTSLTSVTIPNSVTSIEYSAFHGCNSLTIYGTPGSEAEKYAKKQEIQFQAVAPASAAKPASTTEVSREALKATLKKWKFEYTIDGNTVTITKYTGSASAVTIPHGVTSIGYEAFSYCSLLTSVTIPDSVTSIGDYAFWYCENLKSVTIPNSVTSIGKEAFAGCPLMVQLKVKWFKLTHGI